jgi:hypothetical protein
MFGAEAAMPNTSLFDFRMVILIFLLGLLGDCGAPSNDKSRGLRISVFSRFCNCVGPRSASGEILLIGLLASGVAVLLQEEVTLAAPSDFVFFI